MFINILTADKCGKLKLNEILKCPPLSKEASGKESKMGNSGRCVSTRTPVHPPLILSLNRSTALGCFTWGKNKELKKGSFPRVWEAVLAEGWKQAAGHCLRFLGGASNSCSEKKMRVEGERVRGGGRGTQELCEGGDIWMDITWSCMYLFSCGRSFSPTHNTYQYWSHVCF